MSIKLTKRVASKLLHRGKNAIKINAAAIKDANEAITRLDVKNLIEQKKIIVKPKKKNMSRYGKELNKKREKGRRRGKGSRKGTQKVRKGFTYAKEIRAQRRILKALKKEGKINNEAFKHFYALSKGGTFSTKLSLINHIKGTGVQITDEEVEKLRHM